MEKKENLLKIKSFKEVEAEILRKEDNFVEEDIREIINLDNKNFKLFKAKEILQTTRKLHLDKRSQKLIKIKEIYGILKSNKRITKKLIILKCFS